MSFKDDFNVFVKKICAMDFDHILSFPSTPPTSFLFPYPHCWEREKSVFSNGMTLDISTTF